MRALILTIVVCALARTAHAYPQFQLMREPTCTGCHIAPAGGGLLNENGYAVSEAISWKSMDSAFMYGKVPTPSWLQLGGDFRGAAGLMYPGTLTANAYPMQAEIDARVGDWHGFSANAIVGFRSYNQDAGPLHSVWPREHYLMWQQKPGENYGLYVQVGHLMPTYGLRLAEHVVYTQRFGGYPLFHEVYAAQVSYVTAAFEVHASGFAPDPYGDPAERGSGGAAYAEARIGSHAAIGVEGKGTTWDEEDAVFAGVTGKLYIPSADVLLLGEGEYIGRHYIVADDRVKQIAAYVMATKPLPKGLQLDVGVGHLTQDTRVNGDYRDCIDANLHWYTTSHIELMLTTRLEIVNGGGDPYGGYVLAQGHYRL